MSSLLVFRGSLLLVVLALLLACSFDEESGAQEQALIDRFVNAKIRLRQHPSSAEANQEANEALRALIENESLEGDRALVALAGHYLGESSEPECEILRRGERMISLLKEADERPQKVDLPKSDLHSRKGLAEAIRKGEVCE